MSEQPATSGALFGELRDAAQRAGHPTLQDRVAAAEQQFAASVGPDEELPGAMVSALKSLLAPASAETAGPDPVGEPTSGLADLAASTAPPAFAQTAWQPPSPLRRAFRRGAAVLASFDPATLRPVDETAPPGAAETELLGDLVPAYDSRNRENRKMLRPAIRSAVLAELASPEQMRHALDANPDRPRDTQQQIFEDLMLGAAPPIAEQPSDHLRCTLQAVRWLEETDLELPEPEEIQRLIEERRLLTVFDELAENFVGREQELGLLRDYVGVLPPATGLQWIRRQVRQWFDPAEKPPLVFYAAGGVGKSTLIAKFLLDHTHVVDALKVPYVYLDFDSPSLIASQPLTVLEEAARQLAVQYPASKSALQAFVGEVEGAEAPLDTAGLTSPLESARQMASLESGWLDTYARFASLMQTIVQRSETDAGAYTAPFLVVVDTYEDVQLLGIDHEYRLWELLDALRRDFRSLRIVVFGRGVLDRVPTTGEHLSPYLLDNLERGPAELLLERLGVADHAARRRLYGRYGGNPLSLKLAAQEYRENPASAQGSATLEALSRGWRSLFSAGESVVQGQLYQRILGHIRDPEVRRIAHPGLVLRRVTPGLIKEVLQEPCGVPVPTDERAQQLFDGLKAQVALVTLDADGSLRHRSDVRRVMLDLIERDKPAQVARINELAVDFYVRHPGAAPPALARAEELYHRLQLVQDAETVAGRWMPGVEDFLRGSMDELPLPSRHVLASRLGIRLPEDVVAAADLDNWERYTLTQAQALIALGKFADALALLSERPERSAASPLHLVEAQALALLDRTDEAEQALTRALDAAEQSGNRTRMVDAWLLGIELAEQRQDWFDADERLEQAATVTRELGDLPREIELVLRRLRLRQTPPIFPDQDAMRVRLARVISGLADADAQRHSGRPREITDATWQRHPGLVREAVARLGFGYPDLLMRALRTVGAGQLDSNQRLRLVSLLAAVANEVPEARARIDAFARTVGMETGESLALERMLVTLQEVQRLDEFLQQLVMLVAPHPRLRELGSSVLIQMADDFREATRA